MKKFEKGVVSFLDTLKKTDGSYQFSTTSNFSNSLSTCFALLTYELLLNKQTVDTKSIAYLLSFQKDDGIFYDSSLMGESKNTHSQEYINHQVTYHILMVLDAYDVKPKYQLSFLEKYKDVKFLESWLSDLDWRNPWLVSNNVMFILNFLIFQGSNELYTSFILDWLDEHQDSKTGMWNLRHPVTIHNQMAGAFHFLYFYDYLKRDLMHKEAIISNTIAIQEFDGLFSYDTGGGSCDDLDAIDVLARLYYSSESKNEIRTVLSKAKISLLKNQNEDGGFCWAKRTKFNPMVVLKLMPWRLFNLNENLDFKYSIKQKLKNILATTVLRRYLKWSYSGVKSMELALDESDAFSTWFRLLSLKIIESIECDENKVSREKIGIGYFNER